MTIKRKLFVAGASIAFSGILAFANPTEASAATWTARSVEEIKQDIQEDENGSNYMVTWGDTLSAIAAATEISLDTLVEVNNISNADMIIVGNKISLSSDKAIVTVGEGEETRSYDVSHEEEIVEVETPVVETVVETPVVEEVVVEETAPATSEGYTITVEATAYSTNQPSLSDYTYTGINLRQTPNVIAVDPSVIPLGSTVVIPGYGTFIAGDTGSAIVGNRIDVHITDLNAAWAFGRQTMTITVLP
ncbi:3D domain-containing protein [Jeotgalibaca arthritidis]|uniref:LysM peptidoglycan-binding domain-containing protein n=1 Tax=Jeotgalibaca arthritidis TaxID=1868794 RepID=A0A6G7K7R4_9LACT|nr:3D domain-containing protein [Jeotgalibaca arthritidis]QII81309.1 LysM peptidoglycan-binding domain-containing protein [Jeotgalibaca arthritidis]